jgi:formate-dependent nitrite reductase membrane component NrfD
MGRWRWVQATWFEAMSLLLGVGLGFYTGVLLSSISARPLWNSGVLAPLFLVSGLATGGAFLCLFLSHEQHLRLVPLTVLLCGIELLLLLTYVLGLVYGTGAGQRAATILLGGTIGLVFWWVLVVGGLLLPVVLESLDAKGRRLPGLIQRVPPLLKLTGGVALRFIVLYAGLQSFV